MASRGAGCMGKPLVRFCEGPGGNCGMDEILWHRRESRRQTEKTNLVPAVMGVPRPTRKLIKVGARSVETTRRVIVQLSSSRPYLDHYQKISRQVLASGRAAWDTG